MATIHMMRHGQSLHKQRAQGLPAPRSASTDLGSQQASIFRPPAQPHLIIVSPMTRTIQTALIAFQQLLLDEVEVQIWDDLRAASSTAIYNHGLPRADLAAKFPQFDFSACRDDWDYEPHSFDDAVARAERVRLRLKDLACSGAYKNIMVVLHRIFIAFLVEGKRFDVCECRSYRFASDDEVDEDRHGSYCDTGVELDFGPSLLMPVSLVATGDEGAKTEKAL
ncbi:histidine phosphatase superfamily [Podospora didyma]|uniref:Histidine phosphatase superfamily n=1 Tax=Podospora didyma TaxID=330526 RepID=A0AAE0NI03_9PEZI|nr:histidine phosphatase superfamily [Podospora didyma]